MKQISRLCALLIVVFSTASILFAQQTSDDAKDFDAIYRKSFELKREKSFRLKTTSETFDTNGTTLKSKYVSTYEVVPPDRSYFSATYEGDSTKKKSESITISGKRFVRIDGGKWEIDNSKGQYGTAAEGRSSIKLIEKTTFNNQTANVYEVKGGRYNSSDGDSKFTAKYWFSEEGLLLKEESEETFNNRIVRRISIYEYDANIKIEAPNVSEKTN
jgi:hypothetical protein